MSTPQTTVYLCKGVRLDNRYEHTLYFDKTSAQRNFFAKKVDKTFLAYTYARKSWPLQVQATMEEARVWNYLYFTNGTGKTYYYFVTNVEYKNDNMVELTLELDVMQTYLFDIVWLPCFVERQHTPTDAIGEHTVAEGLEMGPYWNYHIFDLEDISTMGVLVLSSVDLTRLTSSTTTSDVPKAYAKVFNGVYSGLGVYAFDDMNELERKLNILDKLGMPDAVVAIWMYPKKLVEMNSKLLWTETDPCSWDDFNWSINSCGIVLGMESQATTLATYDNYMDNLFEGYAKDVKNNKLFTSPYNLLYITTNQGTKAEYKFEHFTPVDGKYSFELYGAISPDGGVKMAPVAYNIPGTNVNYDEGITLGNYPSCAWDSDTYKVWLAQNYNQLQHAVDTGAGSAALGLGLTIAGVLATVGTGGLGALGAVGAVGAVGGGIGSLYSGYSQVSGIMAQKEDAKAQPPQARGNFSSTVNVASGRQTFTAYYKCIRKEYAQQIDDYFTLYGYRINRVQQPNINARPAFTYVKTVGCKIGGYLCADDAVKVEGIMDKGITFWKNGDSIGNYTAVNNKPT